MPPIMPNSKDDQDHNDNYFDTSRNILSKEIPSNITSKSWQINVPLTESSKKTFEEIDSFSKLIIILIWNF